MSRAALMAVLALGCTQSADRAQKAEAVANQGGPLRMDEHAGRGITAAPDRMRVKTDLVKIRAAILRHQRMNDGQNPADIANLEEIDGLFYGDDYEYDAGAAVVKSRTYPEM